MKTYLTRVLSAAVLTALPLNAFAADAVLHLGYSLGGDTVATVMFTDGSSEDAKVNMGLDIAGGIAFGSTRQGGVQGRVMAGYVIGGAGASNGGVDWRSPHVDVIGLYKVTDVLGIGVGGTYHIDPEVKSTGDLSGRLHYEFESAFGPLVTLEYNANAIFFALRYTTIDYELSKASGVAVSGVESNGDSLGLYAGLRW